MACHLGHQQIILATPQMLSTSYHALY